MIETNDLGVIPAPPPQATCPSGELLVAYLTDTLGASARVEMEAHLRLCDPCTELLPVVQRRLRVVDATPIAIPPAVRDLLSRQRSGAVVPLRRNRHPVLSALIPLALAALALLAVWQPRWVDTAPPSERSRGIERHEVLAVTAARAEVTTQPAGAVIGTVERGTRVTVVAEDDEWFRVELADGRDGWMERRAFQ